MKLSGITSSPPMAQRADRILTTHVGGSKLADAALPLIVFAVMASSSHAVWAERCIAIDGDTLVCNHQKVRLTNVYAAEMNQPGGSAAKKKLQALVQNRDVGLVTHGHDRYGRILAEVYVDGRRIEQADIGPRAGRGSTYGGDRHVYVRTVQAKKAK